MSIYINMYLLFCASQPLAHFVHHWHRWLLLHRLLVVSGYHPTLLCQQALHTTASWFLCNDKARYKCKYMHWRLNERRESNECSCSATKSNLFFMKKKWLGRIKHTKVKWLVPSLVSVEENNHHVLIVINRFMTDTCNIYYYSRLTHLTISFSDAGVHLYYNTCVVYSHRFRNKSCTF